MPYHMFYCDYAEDEDVPAEEAIPADLETIIQRMDSVLRITENFVGMVDTNDVTLQFIVNDDYSIHVDIPIPKKRGSYSKTLPLDACVELVKGIGSTIDPDSIPGLIFESWQFASEKKPWWKFW